MNCKKRPISIIMLVYLVQTLVDNYEQCNIMNRFWYNYITIIWTEIWCKRYCAFQHTLFLQDTNEQKNCQSFQCGFSYLDSLSNALTTRILNSNDRFRICLLNSTANPAHFHQIWAELAVLFSRQILNRSIEFKNSFCQGIR